MTIQDLIYIIPDLINLFLSGFVFMWFYNWLNGKEMNLSIMTVWSLFISFLIKNAYSVAHSFILKNTTVNDSIKIIIFTTTGVILSFICTRLKKAKWMQSLLNQANNKSINDDIFEEIIDYNKSTQMRIYIKDSDICYVGTFSCREEKGIDSWIVLVDYHNVSKDMPPTVNTTSTPQPKSSVAINLKNVERIELFYKDKSKVWETLLQRQESQR